MLCVLCIFLPTLLFFYCVHMAHIKRKRLRYHPLHYTTFVPVVGNSQCLHLDYISIWLCQTSLHLPQRPLSVHHHLQDHPMVSSPGTHLQHLQDHQMVSSPGTHLQHLQDHQIVSSPGTHLQHLQDKIRLYEILLHLAMYALQIEPFEVPLKAWGSKEKNSRVCFLCNGKCAKLLRISR